MPRAPIELTPVQKQEVETLAALLNQDQIADYLGIGRTTVHAIMGRDPEVADRYKRGKAKAIAHVANGLLQKARGGDTTSMIFYLKTQAGWRETERHEHVAGLEVTVVDSYGSGGSGELDELCRRLDSMAGRMAADAALAARTATTIDAEVVGRQDREAR